MSFSVYSIENLFSIYERNAAEDTSRGVAQRTLQEMGLTSTPDGCPRERVYVTTARSSSWGVDVPTARAKEYAAKLWENQYTTKVQINDDNFPKPDSAELAAFKKKVFKVALRTKRAEGWCNDGFEAAMRELDIEVPTTKARITLELDFADYDSTLTAKSALGDVRSFLKWDIDTDDLTAAVTSVEPIKD